MFLWFVCRWFFARPGDHPLRLRLETRLRYTSTTVFDSFPWPQAPTPTQVNDIEKTLDELLQVHAKNLAAGMSLARQYDTLRQPGKSRLRTLHADLDAAVLSDYGFSTDDDLLAQLLALTSTSLPNQITPGGLDGGQLRKLTTLGDSHGTGPQRSRVLTTWLSGGGRIGLGLGFRGAMAWPRTCATELNELQVRLPDVVNCR